jgi:hypothetical protein
MLPQPAPALAVSPEPPAFPDDSEVYDPEVCPTVAGGWGGGRGYPRGAPCG